MDSETKGTVNLEKPHYNLVFIGHIDAGKSTLSGQVLISAGKVDKRTLEKYQAEAAALNRQSWYLAYVMDQFEEERAKGKTAECGRGSFETESKRFTLLDAPGHKQHIQKMILGASQADIAALVISARKGEFEAGFERGGQTTEHLMLIRTLGVQKLYILVNKMDDKTVEWSKERYDDIVKKLSGACKQYGFKPEDVTFIPVSAYSGANIKDKYPDCSWYSGKSFFESLDNCSEIVRGYDKPLRIPVSAKYKDRGLVFAMGKMEYGVIKVGDSVTFVPVGKKANVIELIIEDTNVQEAKAGENILIGLKGIEEDEFPIGSVICHENTPCYKTNMIECQLLITDVNENIPVIAAGYECVLHTHTATSECEIKQIVSVLDKKGRPKKVTPKFITTDDIAVVRIELKEVVPMEKYSELPNLARFTLRDKAKTTGIGKVLRLKPV